MAQTGKNGKKAKNAAIELERIAKYEDSKRKKAQKRNIITVVACLVAAFAVVVTMALVIPPLAKQKNEASSETNSSDTSEEATANPSVINADSYSGELPTVDYTLDVPTISFPSDYTSPTDLVVKTLSAGDGDAIDTSKDTVSMNYSGWLTDGTEFDSSIDPAKGHVGAFDMAPGSVIEGWIKGLNGTHVGDKVMLVIPSVMGYGEKGSGKSIPPNSPLVFYVDIISKK